MTTQGLRNSKSMRLSWGALSSHGHHMVTVSSSPFIDKTVIDITLRPGAAAWRTRRNSVVCDSAHRRHYVKTWRHPQNRKYTTTALSWQHDRATAAVNMHRKFREVWTCGFCPRNTMLSRYLPSSCLSVCLSVTSRVLLRRLHLGSRKQRHTIAQGLYFLMPKISAKFQSGAKYSLVGSNRRFSTNISLYLNKKLSYRRETRATLCISWNVVLLLYD